MLEIMLLSHTHLLQLMPIMLEGTDAAIGMFIHLDSVLWLVASPYSYGNGFGAKKLRPELTTLAYSGNNGYCLG